MSLRKGILWRFVAVLVVAYPGMAFAQLAPQSQEEFEQRFTGWTLQADAPDCNEGDGVEPINFIEPGRFATRGLVEIGDRMEYVNLEGDYEYEETGPNTGSLAITVDDLPIPQVLDLTFNSQTMGMFTVALFGVVACRGSFELIESTVGEQIYYFPHLAVGAGWQTTLTYINHSSEEVNCQTNFLSDQGSPLTVSFAGLGAVESRTDVLPPGGSVHEETDVELSAPLVPGWARASCSGPVKASLLFRRHNSQGVPVAEGGVNATTVPATRFVTFAEQGEGRFGTGVAYANPSDRAARVTFTSKDATGRTLASVDRNLLSHGHGAQNMARLFALGGFTGSLEVTSSEPIVTLSLNFEADPVFSSLPPGELDAAAEGTTTYYFPHLAVGAGWQTTLTYINYSSAEVSCQTDFLSDQGSPLMVSFAGLGAVESRTDVLSPGGSVHEETNVELSAPLAPGWARASCSGPVKASLLFRRFEGGVPTGEAGVNAATLPATRFVTFAEQGEGRFGTGVAYANPSDRAARITFTAKDAGGQTLASVDRTLLPNGHGAQNMAPLFGLSDFTGSLEITSSEPIVTLSLNFEADPVFSSLPPGETVTPPDTHSGGNPDLTIYSITAFTNSSGTPAGGAFSLAAGVRNVGNGASPATTLRYYRSTDATITSGDTSVGTDALSALSPSGLTEESIRLMAPSSGGTYYYGACVEAVSGESRTTNNCSRGRRVVVTAGRDQGNGSATSREETVLAALFDFQDVDEVERPFGREEIVDLLSRNDDSLERFTWETSRNLVSVDFDVLDWITVDKKRTDYPLGGGGVVADAVNALSYHADLSRYDKVLLFIYPLEQGYPGCQAFLGPRQWQTPNGTFKLGAAWLSGYDMGCVRKGRIAHEYMHTFGFLHSYLIRCSKEPPVPASLIDPTDRNDSCFVYRCVDDDCTETRPADSGITANADWDVLGGDHKYEELFPFHVHATWQAQAGWLGEDQVIEARATGSYRITTLESLDPGPKAIRVPLGLNHRGEPSYYWLQTREFSPWSPRLFRPNPGVKNLSPCQVDVRLEATGVFGPRGGHTGSSASKNTYIFDGHDVELTDGRRRIIRGESVVRPQIPFHDPYRGLRMEIADCVESGDGTAIEVLIDTTTLTADPPIVALFDDEQRTTVTVTNGGTRAVRIGSAAVGGRHPDAFSVLSDGCVQLEPGASCAIVVSYDGGTAGNPNHHAVLKIPNDDGLAPHLSVSLFGEVGRPR